jgi:hypothetical protein
MSTDSEGCAAAMPARASVTTVSGLLMSFFMACLPLRNLLLLALSQRCTGSARQRRRFRAADKPTVTRGARERPEWRSAL